MPAKIQTHRDLLVYQKSFEAAMQLFELSKNYPKEETYSLTDQMRCSSRSVCANLAEAWRKRRYQNAFVSKVCDSEGEAAETQVWIEFSVGCGYMNKTEARSLYNAYDEIIAMLVSMSNAPEKWVLPSGLK
jgi:four helix bundle protein